MKLPLMGLFVMVALCTPAAAYGTFFHWRIIDFGRSKPALPNYHWSGPYQTHDKVWNCSISAPEASGAKENGRLELFYEEMTIHCALESNPKIGVYVHGGCYKFNHQRVVNVEARLELESPDSKRREIIVNCSEDPWPQE